VTSAKTWLAGARPRTLPAAVVPVLVGTACAIGVPRAVGTGVFQIGADSLDPAQVEPVIPTTVLDALRSVSWSRFLAALIVALAIQIGTNYANDYSDGKRGTDDPGRRTGPPRLVGWGLAEPSQVKAAAVGSFAVAAVAGLYLAATVSWWLLVVGAASIAAGWFYTGGPRPYGYAGFGELFVFIFFGLVATMGSAYVQTGHLQATSLGPQWAQHYPWLTLGAAAAVGCLSTALLVVNNLRDIPSDAAVGKLTLAVLLGDPGTRVLYVVLMVLPFLLVPVVCGLGGRPFGAASLFAIVAANAPVLQVLQGAKGPALVPVLGQTGRVQLIFGVLLAVGLLVSAVA
jgi:1,4-dihydroxy-2-naphthoate octaprenyltransferase